MKAIVCHEFAPVEQLQFEDLPDPTPGPDEVLIEVGAAGVNFPDSLLVQGQYQMQPPRPFVPGSEVAGVISALGDKVPHLKVGMRVIGFCMLGGYAQKVVCKAMQTMPIPDNLPTEEAAALITAHATAHHGLKQRAQLQPGETLVVTGAAGGTGLAAVQIGKAMGARVIAVCSSEEKLALAKANGADEGINYQQQDLKEAIKSLTDGKGADVVYECVGGDAFAACSRAMAWNGRLLVVGFASGDIPQFAVNLALVKGYAVLGVFWGSFTQHQPKDYMANMQELMHWYAEGKVKVVVDEALPLADAVKALQKMQRREVKGKLVLLP